MNDSCHKWYFHEFGITSIWYIVCGSVHSLIEFIVGWLVCGVLVIICLNFWSWYFIVNHLCQICCPFGIRWYWNLLVYTCWRLYKVLGLSCLHSLNWKILMWGRWYWIFVCAGNSFRWYKINIYLMNFWCSDMYSGRGILGTFTARILFCFMTPCSKGLSGPYMLLNIT